MSVAAETSDGAIAPWYEGGLAFSCTRCGDCCTGEGGHVWVDRRAIRRLAARLGLDLQAFGRRYLRQVGQRYSLVERPDGACVFWNHGCEVYEDRPLQCRTYPFWPANLASARAWRGAAKGCPGIGQGTCYDRGTIERLRDGGGETRAADPVAPAAVSASPARDSTADATSK